MDEESIKRFLEKADSDWIKLAIFMHKSYEANAHALEWKTQEKCQVSFWDLPMENKATMLAVAECVHNEFIAKVLERNKMLERQAIRDSQFVYDTIAEKNELRKELDELKKRL